MISIPVLILSLIVWFTQSSIAIDNAIPSNQYYQEHLKLKPLPRNKLLSVFDFQVSSLPFQLSYHNHNDTIGTNNIQDIRHYTYFPSTLGPIIESTNTRELSLRFTQGWWDAESWGKLPNNGKFTGGTGVEVIAIIEAPNIDIAKANWHKLNKVLSGFFCASLNFIQEEITTYPKFMTNKANVQYLPEEGNKLYLMRAALPSEPVCTENLTPFLRLLPTRGKSGISSLLDGHKVFDSLWHGMSIDVTTECSDDDENNNNCSLKLHSTVNQVVDIIRSIRKKEEGGIPKPIAGDKLRCDKSKAYTAWQCFPLGDPTELQWSLETIYGRNILGPAFEDDTKSSGISTTEVTVEADPQAWKVQLRKLYSDYVVFVSMSDGISESDYLREQIKYDVRFETTDSSVVLPIESPPLYVSRSLTGYSLDQGGLRVSFSNPSTTESVKFIYSESVPWFMRLYLHTLDLSVSEIKGISQHVSKQDHSLYIKSTYYRPAMDRHRPNHMELTIVIPANSTLTMTYQFDKSLLLYREYPPDANHGFDVEPGVISILDEQDQEVYQFRTTSLLLTLPTPDFSMPYNVIILTCTVLSLAFGIVFNLLTKRVVTEEEFEKITEASKLTQLKKKIRLQIQKVKYILGI
ncbi:GPI16 [[Candida] subhashii]|uniref:GPI16 n=1 Tax=[Candida] subhashii TaxID=561895 RepID=A0A8J5QTK7_9ASCO|nr:GPI16 [[Candida] subhashii]KAG7666038.1 GPI16 [[Candida] subhashii]